MSSGQDFASPYVERSPSAPRHLPPRNEVGFLAATAPRSLTRKEEVKRVSPIYWPKVPSSLSPRSSSLLPSSLFTAAPAHVTDFILSPEVLMLSSLLLMAKQPQPSCNQSRHSNKSSFLIRKHILRSWKWKFECVHLTYSFDHDVPNKSLTAWRHQF